jgi:hypothetical protein
MMYHVLLISLYQQVANVAVHEVQFVKGAVNMETLPEEGIPEACFAVSVCLPPSLPV